MSTYASERIEKNSFQWNPPKSRNVVVVIYLLEAITKVGRHFPVIVLSLASLNVVMAANDFLANSVEFGIMNSLFAIGGVISLVQMHQRTKIQSMGSYKKSNFKKTQKIGNEMR
ncbi:MAG: hypothetical protein PVI88_04190 [Nitrosopumilaceae archaeon]|jgi:hypothetical protein